jgi:hypothetical protein
MDSDVEFIGSVDFGLPESREDAKKQLQHFFATGCILEAKDIHDDDDEGDGDFMSGQTREDGKDQLTRNAKVATLADGEEFVLEILGKFDALSSVKFKGRAKKGWLPFVHLLHLGSNTETLRKAHAINDKPLGSPFTGPGEGTLYPLHYALLFRSRENDVIRFLAKKCPAALEEPTDDGRFPIHIAIEKRAHLTVFQCLLDSHPGDAVSKEQHFNECLSRACVEDGISDEVIKLLAQKFYQSNNVTRFQCTLQVARRLHGGKLLKRMLKKLKHFTFLCDDSEEEEEEESNPGMDYSSVAEKFLSCLRTYNKKWITSYGVSLCEEEKPSDPYDVLEGLIQRYRSIETISLEWTARVGGSPSSALIDLDPDGHPLVLDTSNKGQHRCQVSYNRHSQTISFNHGNFELSNFMTPTLSGLSYNGANLVLGKRWPWVVQTGPNSCLKELRLVDTTMPPRCLKRILKYAAELPHLEILMLSYSKEISLKVSVPIAELTRLIKSVLMGEKLTSLEITGLKVDSGDLCASVKSNSKLNSLVYGEMVPADEVAFLGLMGCNTTLETVGIGGGGRLPFSNEASQSILYYTKLNYFGRGKVKDITLKKLIDLLCGPLMKHPEGDISDLEDDEDDAKDETIGGKPAGPWHGDPVNIFNVHYCLLRECPHLFSVTPQGRRKGKRKWHELVEEEVEVTIIDD